jgi:DNA-binding response OmpR family regulator
LHLNAYTINDLKTSSRKSAPMETMIMIVDKEKEHGDFLVRYFSEREYMACAVATYEEALKLLETITVDIAIIEYCRDSRAADALCAAVRACGQATGLVLMCGCQSSETEKRARQFAPAFYFVKPFNVDDLYAVVLRIARKKAGVTKARDHVIA